MSNLIDMNCVSVRAGDPQASAEESAQYMQEVPDWEIIDVDGVSHLQRVYKFQNFVEALSFTNKVGALAEQQDHHPDIVLSWGLVKVTIWTHKIDGLTESDFYFAAKVEEAFAKETN